MFDDQIFIDFLANAVIWGSVVCIIVVLTNLMRQKDTGWLELVMVFCVSAIISLMIDSMFNLF